MTRDSTPPEPSRARRGEHASPGDVTAESGDRVAVPADRSRRPGDRARQVLSWTALALIVTAVVIVIVSIVLSDEASAPTRPAGQVTTVTDTP